MMQEKTGEKPEIQAEKRESISEDREKSAVNTVKGVFSDDIVKQLTSVFSKMEHSLILKLSLDDMPVSSELRMYMEEMAALTDKLHIEIEEHSQKKETPCVSVCYANGTDTGIRCV